MAQHGHIVWNELNTRDPQAAMRFYGASVGWTFEMRPMAEGAPYWLAKAGEVVVAGLFTMVGSQFFGVPEHWFAYLEVDDIDGRVAGVAAAGGTVMRKPWTVADVGRIAIVRAPGGGVMGWMTSARPA